MTHTVRKLTPANRPCL